MKRNDEKLVLKPYVSKRAKKQKLEHNSSAACGAINEQSSESDARQNTLKVNGDNNRSDISTILPNLTPGNKIIVHKTPRYQIDCTREHSNVACVVEWNPCFIGKFVSASFDKQIIIWDTAQGKLNATKRILLHDQAVKDVKWNHDGSVLLTASYDKTAKCIDVDTGVSLTTYTHDDMVTSILHHPTDRNFFLTGTMKSGIFAWDQRQENCVRNFKSFFGQVHDLLFLPDDATFLSCAEVIKKNSMDKAIIAWDFKTSAALPYQIYQEPHTCTRLLLNPNKKQFYAQSSAGYVAIFDVSSPWRMNKHKRYEGHQCVGYRIGIDMSSDSHYFYSGDNDGHLYMYDAYNSSVLKTMRLFSSPCVDVSCNPYHQSELICSSWEGEIVLLQ